MPLRSSQARNSTKMEDDKISLARDRSRRHGNIGKGLLVIMSLERGEYEGLEREFHTTT